VSLGWRLHRFVAVHSALSSFALDAASRTVTNPDGSVGEEVAFGRLTALDVATVRLYVPLPKRLEPWGEVGAGVGVRRAPFAGRRQAAGLARVGVGLDFWLAPSFTIGASAAYRLTVIGKAAGHGLRTGLDLGIHW
nr:hypothetical protein [Deltaproteobacteria bacterium]